MINEANEAVASFRSIVASLLLDIIEGRKPYSEAREMLTIWWEDVANKDELRRIIRDEAVVLSRQMDELLNDIPTITLP